MRPSGAVPQQPPRPKTGARGFTLLEAVITVAVVVLLVAAAVPSYANYLARQRLRAAAELLEQDLRRARTLSVNEGRNIYVNFASGPAWCWGVSRQAPCDCSTGQPRCELSGVTHHEFKGLLLQSGQNITFQAGLGRALDWTRIGMSNDHNHQLHIDLSPVGRPQICGSDSRRGDSC